MPWVPLHVVSDQRTRKPRTGVGVSASGSSSALRAISACLCNLQFLRLCFAPFVSLSESAVPCGSLCSITPPLKGGGVEWSRKETDQLLHLLHWSSLEHGAKRSAILTHCRFPTISPCHPRRTGSFLRISYRCTWTHRASDCPFSRQSVAPIVLLRPQ